MTDSLPIGTTTTVTLKFRNNPTFTTAPNWELTIPDGSVLVSGTAVISGTADSWDITLTLPTTYSTTSGSDIVTLELFGTDANGIVRSVQETYTVLDAVDDFFQTGVVVQDGQPGTDYLVLNSATHTATDITLGIYAYDETVLYADSNPTLIGSPVRVMNRSDVPDRFTDPSFTGYRYQIQIPALNYPTLTRFAHQARYTVTSGGAVVTQEVHPVYRINGLVMMHLNNLQMFLDKARLNEIDQTLQWQQDELIQALLEGVSYVNGYPSTLSYWTVEDFPFAMHTYLWYAAALYALNARYLAEGFTAFEFSGLSTSLTVDRREAITYKIEELKAFLENNLPKAKAAAIRTVGVGTVPATNTPSGNNNARLGIGASPVSNVTRRYGYNHFRGSYYN